MSVPYVFDGQLDAGDDDCLCELCGETVDAWPVETAEAICRDCEAERRAIEADQAADLADAVNACAQELRLR